MTAHDDGEIDDLAEFFATLGKVERDEQLVDLLGQGYDVNAPGDQAVADMLGSWRDDIDSEPLEDLTKTTLRGQHSSGAQMPANTGGTMSFEDLAGQFAGLKSMTPHTEAQTLDTALGQLGSAGAEILGESTSANWQATVNQVRAEVAAVMAALESIDGYIDETAGKIRNQQL